MSMKSLGKIMPEIKQQGFSVVSSALGIGLHFDNFDQIDALIKNLQWLKDESIKHDVNPPYMLLSCSQHATQEEVDELMNKFAKDFPTS